MIPESYPTRLGQFANNRDKLHPIWLNVAHLSWAPHKLSFTYLGQAKASSSNINPILVLSFPRAFFLL